jgi:hypothetical protein
MFWYAEQGVQVLPGLRELQLQGLHHREVLRQRARVMSIEEIRIPSSRLCNFVKKTKEDFGYAFSFLALILLVQNILQ